MAPDPYAGAGCDCNRGLRAAGFADVVNNLSVENFAELATAPVIYSPAQERYIRRHNPCLVPMLLTAFQKHRNRVKSQRHHLESLTVGSAGSAATAIARIISNHS
jgi:hypothetical protein